MSVNDQSYSQLLSTLDTVRQDRSRLEAELRKVRHELALEKYRRLTAVIKLAIERRDTVTWLEAAKERAGLGVSFVEAAEMGAA
jgi:hypothetical protein